MFTAVCEPVRVLVTVAEGDLEPVVVRVPVEDDDTERVIVVDLVGVLLLVLVFEAMIVIVDVPVAEGETDDFTDRDGSTVAVVVLDTVIDDVVVRENLIVDVIILERVPVAVRKGVCVGLVDRVDVFVDSGDLVELLEPVVVIDIREERDAVEEGDTDREIVGVRVDVREIVVVRVDVIVAVPVFELSIDLETIGVKVFVFEEIPVLDSNGDLEGDLEPVEDLEVVLEGDCVLV